MTTRNAYLILVLVVFVFVVYLILNPDKLSDTWFGEKKQQQAEKEPPTERPNINVNVDVDTVYLDTHSVAFARQIDGKFIVYGSGGMYYVIVTQDVYAKVTKQLNIASTSRWGSVRFKSRYWVRNYPQAITIEDVRP